MENILCFGDSLTAGYYNEGKNFYPYSKKLSKLLDDKYHIDYIGLSGWTTEEMINNKDNINCEDCLEKIWFGLSIQLRQKKYKYCIILAGTNDLEENNSIDIITNILSIHQIAINEGCKTIALTIPPMRIESVIPEIKEKRQNINDSLKSYSEIETIDISNNNLWDSDGLHFSPEGYDEIANKITNYFTTIR